jgi:hypothetical protein
MRSVARGSAVSRDLRQRGAQIVLEHADPFDVSTQQPACFGRRARLPALDQYGAEPLLEQLHALRHRGWSDIQSPGSAIETSLLHDRGNGGERGVIEHEANLAMLNFGKGI